MFIDIKTMPNDEVQLIPCDRCGRPVNNEEILHDVMGFAILCIRCHDMLIVEEGFDEDDENIFDEEDIAERNVNLKSTKYVGKTAGTIIKSKRKFGVEFEINLNGEGQNSLRKELAQEYGLVHDGSVNNGIEVVSPILGGGVGEKQIIATCKALAKVKAGADDSCGMHVHLDAPDFYCNEETPILNLATALRVVHEKDYEGYRFMLLSSSTIKDLKNNQELFDKVINRRFLDAFSLSEWENYFSGLQSFNVAFAGELKVPTKRFFLVAPIGSRGSRMPVNDEIKSDADIKKYRGEPTISQYGYGTFAVVDPKTSTEDIVIMVNTKQVNEKNNMIERLKRVASAYVAFDDVIASMLPCDRRDNDFSKRINVRMSINDIGRVESFLDFFNLWTKTKNLHEFRRSQQEQRHESRYSGINFRALLKHGTIEVRYHAGTTDANKTLHWVALHQRIVDLAADLNNPRFNLDRLEKAAMIVDIDAKTNLFFKKLCLTPETEEYLLGRIAKFKGQDSVFVESLIADDQ